MGAPKYDVVIVGAGPAGITAAIALAKAEIPVLVIEGGVFPGAENWSGAVYFAENLARPDVLGPQAVADSAYERPVTKRGVNIYNGHSLVGLTYRNPETFANCYTVLRPTYDHYLAELAKSFGATILTETTVDGLLRDEQDKIIGVHTDRGPVYADVVFLAEGDASHLVAKEGYEHCQDPGAPHFLQGIAEVIELDPQHIEHNFGLPPGEGAAHEILLRNGWIHNRPANLNMGGFIYTNAASVSLGLVMPLDNLAREFGGDHNRLMEWYKALPEIRRLTGGGRSIAYGAKIIRGGGFRELPRLIDDGLAIGGAATGIGLDFPYPNFTGPATAMGRLFANAVKQIRAANKPYSRSNLDELYEQPLRQTHYFRNVEFLEKWPHYVKHTRVFFGRAVDLATGSLYIAGHRDLSVPQRIWQLAKYLRETLPAKSVKEFLADMRAQREALGLTRVSKSVVGAISNRDRASGVVTLDFFVDGQPQTNFLWPISRLFKELPAALCVASDHLYRNDDTPLPNKLRNAIAAAKRGVSLLDYLALGSFGVMLLLLMPIQWACEMIKLVITRPSPEKYLSGFFQKYRALTRARTKLDPDAIKIAQPWEEKLSLIRYFSEEHTHIKVFRPELFQDRSKIASSPLWHVCPAKVYECRPDDLGQSQVIVNFENCIKCESCLRGAPANVDWTRQRGQRLIFGAPTTANRKLLELLKRVSSPGVPPVPVVQLNGRDNGSPQLAAKLREFCAAVYAEPRYLDTARIRWLHSLLDEARALAPDNKLLGRVIAHANNRKFFWAEADARQILNHLPAPPSVVTVETPDLSFRHQLDKLFPKQSIKHLERGQPLTADQLIFLQGLVGAIFNRDSSPLAIQNRSHVLKELARKDPSLAALVSGIYSAQIAARPELAGVPWIGLTAARTHWKDFPPTKSPALPQVAADICAIVLGAGEMLLERCRAHATSRVQFPGLFKDEDGRDGIAKFGAVKALLGQMEAQQYLLESLADAGATDAPLIKILAAEAFGPDPGSLAYNAGQIFGGTAYSEDDILSKFYRDSTCFSHLLFDDEDLKRQLGPDADEKLRAFALKVVKQRAVNPAELEAEIVKMFAVRAASSINAQSLGAQILEHGYCEQALEHPPEFSYRAALQTEQHYDYGDYLTKPFDQTSWRYVPEMLFADAELHVYHAKLYKYFTENFWERRFNGQPYHRLVETLHKVPLEDVREMVTHRFTRMYIPKEFGGEGLLKAHYYILCPLSMRYADPSYALTIMAHSSIGTTPVLIALNQDLPRAKSDLQAFLADQSTIRHLQSEIKHILRMLDSPQALKVKDVFTALGEKVKNDIGKKPMLRAVASDFLAHFMDAGRAGLRMDLANFKTELQKSLVALDSIQSRAAGVVAELERRADASKLFLKLVSAGQISAFALTEPSAGSDSGGVQTNAKLKRVEVLTDADGSKYFILGKERRNLLNAATVDVSKIDYSGYDYVTSTGVRRYEGREFHDIAQIRREDGREFYEYYELNGAKMWITNGHVAGVMCLYARTAEGTTGFIVDRHAEGLVVGKDEEKMGQRGSPTNELGLTGVRVPRENIIGIEGRGQVNALETLNVGRTGLAVSATAMTAKVVEQSRTFARAQGLDKEPWVQQLIGEMTAELFAAESLAYELIGRFDHHGTKSVRTESAIGKYYASEVLHRVIRSAEKIFGIEGVTQLHEIEKHRRDARVLNIYEGTNEVQRFLILRDLVDAVLPKATTEAMKDESVAFLMSDLKSAVETFGAQVWQNTAFQPTMFKLTDIAGYIKSMDSAQWRVEWLRQNTGDADTRHRQMAESAYDSFCEHSLQQIRRLHEEFVRELALLKQGLYPPEVRTAFLALQAEDGRKKKALRQPPAHNITKPLHIVVVMNVVPVLSPRPRVMAGELLETHFEFDATSRTALARAIEMAGSKPTGRITALTVAPRYATDLLRRALSMGATDAALLETEELCGDIHGAARLLADHIAMKQAKCDLVLCGDSILAAVLGGNLGMSHQSGVSEFTMADGCWSIWLEKPAIKLERAGPMVLGILAGETCAEFSAGDAVAALGKPLEIVDTRHVEAVPHFMMRYALPTAPANTEKLAATPEEAAALVRALTGVAAGGTGSAGQGAFNGAINLVEMSRVPTLQAAVFVATPDHVEGADFAAACAEVLNLPFSIVVLGNPDEKSMRQIAAQLPAESVFFVSNPNLQDGSPEGLLAALQSLWKDSLPVMLTAGVWANEILARFGKTFPRVQARYNVAEIAGRDGRIDLSWPVFGGKVQRVARIAELREHPLVMTLAAGAIADVGVSERKAVKQVFNVPLKFEYDRKSDELAQLMAAGSGETGTISIANAEVIIDVGYAIRNKENFDLIVAPLKKRLEEIGIKGLAVGGTRKVVEELKLLAPDQQIGQTGQSVNPKLIISLGVSGAPQHVDYIGENATIIAFNKDADAPLMTLNKRRARPKVVPIVGDLYKTVPSFTAALKP